MCIMVMSTCTVVVCNTLRTNFAAMLLVVPIQVLKLGSWCLCSCRRDQLQREMGTRPPPFFPGCRQVQHLPLPQLWPLQPFLPPVWSRVLTWPPPRCPTASQTDPRQIPGCLVNCLRRRRGMYPWAWSCACAGSCWPTVAVPRYRLTSPAKCKFKNKVIFRQGNRASNQL